MTTQLLMIQAISENIALFSCAIFAGGSVYISLVEDPATAEGGIEMAGSYLLSAHPRPAVVQTLFAVIAALTGILAGLAGHAMWWIIVLTRLTRLHAGLGLAGLAALFIFIMKT